MTRSQPPAMEFEYVDSFDRFFELEEEWDDLESRSACHVFQNYRFLRSWLETAGRATSVRLATVLYRENGILRGIFPGCVTKRMGVPTLTWLGGFYVVDYGDVLFDHLADLPLHDFVNRAFKLLKKRLGFHVCFLDNVRKDASIYPFLRNFFRPYRNGVAPYIELHGCFEQYLDSLKVFRKKMKSDTLRQIKRLSALGALEFRVCELGEQVVDPVIEVLLEQKRARLTDRGQRGAIELPGYTDLLFSEVCQNRFAHVSYLSLNNEIIAVHFGYKYRNRRMYYYMPSFAAGYAPYSPGRVLIYYLVEYCFRQGVEIFDFTVGHEEYKYEWTREEMTLTNFMRNDIKTRVARFLLYFRDPVSSQFRSPVSLLRRVLAARSLADQGSR